MKTQEFEVILRNGQTNFRIFVSATDEYNTVEPVATIEGTLNAHDGQMLVSLSPY